VNPVAAAVTALFVPGNRPDRFLKAARSGADLVIIDLEDAVAADERLTALRQTTHALNPDSEAMITAVVRVTDPTSPTHLDEVQALARVATRPGNGLLGVMVPKAADPGMLARVGAAFADVVTAVPVIPLIESAAGIAAVSELARVRGVVRLAFGALDLSLDLGVHVGSDAVRFGQAQVVIHSRAAGLAAPLDTPSVDITDLEAVADAARLSRARGFSGKLCIHPAQVAIVRAAFRPTEAEARWAGEILAHAEENASQVGGRMIDRPILERASRIRHLLQEQS
jgi:citrate lyase subunit beta/citryl-CoA lyase